jgi:hypothetical protein
MRHQVDAPDCAAALAAFPTDIAQWVRAELDDTAPPADVARRHVVLRDQSIFAHDAPTGPRSSNVAAIVAVAEDIEHAAVLRWMLGANESLQVPFVEEAIHRRLGSDPSLAGALLEALAPETPPDPPIVLGVREATAMADAVPAEVAALVRPVAERLTRACTAVPADPARPVHRGVGSHPPIDPRCTLGQISAVARLAARVNDTASCTALAELVPKIARDFGGSEEASQMRMVILRRLADCASRDSIRRAALTAITHYDYVAIQPPGICYDERRELRLAECTDLGLLGAMILVESCNAQVVAAARAAEPEARIDHHRGAIRCVLRACAGSEAAPALREDCWPRAAP